jgi:hypothetical protein
MPRRPVCRRRTASRSFPAEPTLQPQAVARRLQALGFAPAAAPDLAVTVAASVRSRRVGAFTPAQCQKHGWVAQRGKPWLIGGGAVQSLTVRIADRQGRTVYAATASLRAAAGNAAFRASELVQAALPADLRVHPPVAEPC